MNTTKKVKSNKRLFVLLGCLCVLLIGTILLVSGTISFGSDVEKVRVVSITPVYDNKSSMIVNGNSVIFNDKEQKVDYKVVIENPFDYDIKVNEIKLAEPSEEFLKYELKDLDSNTVINANSNVEVVVTLETVDVDGWGRNFNDYLSTAINFEKVEQDVEEPEEEPEEETPSVDDGDKEEIVPPVEDNSDGETDKLPEEEQNAVAPPLTDSEDKLKVLIEINAEYVSPNDMIACNCRWNDATSTYDGCNSYWQYSEKIKRFVIENELREITNYVYKFDVSKQQNGSVVVYLVANTTDPNYYDAYLMADGIIYANENASYYFSQMTYLDEIENFEAIDTSNVTDMSFMFNQTGKNSSVFTLDVSFFETSNVTDMSFMFNGAGFYNPSFTLNIDGFNTSNVTNMHAMFQQTGKESLVFTLDVSDFDTSNVTDMVSMFSAAGYSNPSFTLDVSNFDTSNVTNMFIMFRQTGYSNPNFNLDLSGFDMSNVTNTGYMLAATGYNSNVFNTTITVTNPDLVEYNYMFLEAVTKPGSQITVNYTQETSELVDKMIATKSTNSNVVKGIQIGNKCTENGINTLSDCMLIYDGNYTKVEDAKAGIKKKEYSFEIGSSTDEGIIAVDDDQGTSYLYRGDLNDNFVEFAGHTWRIVRRNGDGSVRLIYNGKSTSAIGYDTTVGNSSYNSNKYDMAFVGYQYGLNQVFKSTTKASIYTTIGENSLYYYATDYECNDETKLCHLTGDKKNGKYKDLYTELIGVKDAEGNAVPYYTCWSTNPDATCSIVSELYSIHQANGQFHPTYVYAKYHGYLTENVEDAYADNINSSIKTKVDAWYEVNLLNTKDASGNKYSSYLSDQIFCNDRGVASGDGYTLNQTTVYNPLLRMRNRQYSLSCPRSEDKFKVSNGKLKYPVGLITMDEAVMVGAKSGATNPASWLNISYGHWTMSPASYNSNNLAADVWIILSTGMPAQYSVDFEAGIRPVINLSKNVVVTGGDGSVANPYRVSLNK